jgi:hypothetical protein
VLGLPGVSFRNVWLRSGAERLLRVGSLRPCTSRTVHRVGSLRSSANTIAAQASLAAYRFSRLGNAYRTAPLAVSSNGSRKLA